MKVLTDSFKMSRYFSHKSSSPSQSLNVVYKFSCLCDANHTHKGETKQHLCVKCLEHVHIEDKTQSANKDHILVKLVVLPLLIILKSYNSVKLIGMTKFLKLFS